MNDPERPEDTTRSDRAGDEKNAQKEASRDKERARLLSKDHLPPITVSDGSFVVEIREPLDPRTNSGNEVRPHRYGTRHALRRILVLDGNGETLFKNREIENCELRFWLQPHDPASPPHMVLRDESFSGVSAFETNEPFETRDPNTVNSFRPNVYRHPRSGDESLFVYRMRVVLHDDLLFQYIADLDHPAGLQVWLWQTRV